MELTTTELVFDRSKGTLRAVAPGGARVLSSASMSWNGCLLEQVQAPPMESADAQWIKNVVVIHLGSSMTFERKEGGRFITQRLEPGQMCLFPAGCVTSARLPGPIEYLSFSLSPGFMAACQGEAGAAPRMELQNRYGVTDKYVEGVCLALREEVRRGGDSGTFYRESLASGLAVHLLKRYGLEQRTGNGRDAGVENQRINRAISYINERLGQELSLHEIAASVDLSPFHFSRMFKQCVGMPPHQFVIQQRLERAKTMLMRRDKPISEVGEELGFADQSHFTSQFRRRCGMTPLQFINLSTSARGQAS